MIEPTVEVEYKGVRVSLPGHTGLSIAEVVSALIEGVHAVSSDHSN